MWMPPWVPTAEGVVYVVRRGTQWLRDKQYEVMSTVPVMLPIGMTMLNATSLVSGLVNEGRIKVGAAQYSVLYASTIPAAMRGDLQPFIIVVTRPS